MAAQILYLVFHLLPMTNLLHYIILKPVGNIKLSLKVQISDVHDKLHRKS
jgi:hypothetical protein